MQIINILTSKEYMSNSLFSIKQISIQYRPNNAPDFKINYVSLKDMFLYCGTKYDGTFNAAFERYITRFETLTTINGLESAINPDFDVDKSCSIFNIAYQSRLVPDIRSWRDSTNGILLMDIDGEIYAADGLAMYFMTTFNDGFYTTSIISEYMDHNRSINDFVNKYGRKLMYTLIDPHA